jgi:hypothetical protein
LVDSVKLFYTVGAYKLNPNDNINFMFNSLIDPLF